MHFPNGVQQLSVSGGGLSKSLHDNFIRELALFAHFGMPHSERAFNVQDRAKFGWRQEQQEKSPQVEERRLNLARISQCAQTARIASGGRFHPESCRFGLVAGKRPGWVTGRAEALRQRPPLGG